MLTLLTLYVVLPGAITWLVVVKLGADLRRAVARQKWRKLHADMLAAVVAMNASMAKVGTEARKVAASIHTMGSTFDVDARRLDVMRHYGMAAWVRPPVRGNGS